MARAGLPEYTERQAVQSQTLGEPLLEKRPVVKGACRSCVGVISQKYINTFRRSCCFRRRPSGLTVNGGGTALINFEPPGMYGLV